MKCDICGEDYPPEQTIVEQDMHIICIQCNTFRHSCQTCVYANCTGAPDKYIYQTRQVGNMVTHMPVLNPAFIEKHCNSCKCFVKDTKTCLREQGGCAQHKIRWNT